MKTKTATIEIWRWVPGYYWKCVIQDRGWEGIFKCRPKSKPEVVRSAVAFANGTLKKLGFTAEFSRDLAAEIDAMKITQGK